MKKLLTLLAAVGLTATASVGVIACSGDKDDAKDLSKAGIKLTATNDTKESDVLKAIQTVKGLEKVALKTDVTIAITPATKEKAGSVVITAVKGSKLVSGTVTFEIKKLDGGTVTPSETPITIENVKKAVGEIKDLENLEAVNTALAAKLKDTKDETLKGVKSLIAAAKGESKTDVTVTAVAKDGYKLDNSTYDITGAIKGGTVTPSETPITIENVEKAVGEIKDLENLEAVNNALAAKLKDTKDETLKGVKSLIAAAKGESKTDVTVTAVANDGYKLDNSTYDITGAIKAASSETK